MVPSLATDAMAGAALDQLTVWPVITLPDASRAVADRCAVPPTTTRTVSGVIVSSFTCGAVGDSEPQLELARMNAGANAHSRAARSLVVDSNIGCASRDGLT